MQPSPSSQNASTGKLLGTFRHGKAAIVFLLIFALVLFGMAIFVLYLSQVLPIDPHAGPVNLHSRRGDVSFSSPLLFMYASSGFLALLGVCMLFGRAWLLRLRKSSFEVYEHGITEVTGTQREYLAFTEIQDLYLFSAGQLAVTGMITNLAYRRNADQPWHHAMSSLKSFFDFEQLVRELYVRERLPVVFDALQAGNPVTFNYISTGQVWRKRMVGNFLNITTQPLVVTRDYLEVQGHKVPMSSLLTIDLNTWTEKVVIKDETGKEVLNTLGTGILGHDLFLSTLDALMELEQAKRGNTAPVQA